MDNSRYVAAENPPATIDGIRRSDVMAAVGSVVDIYTQQQRQALRGVAADVGARGYCSDAAAVAERRKTSRLYLWAYAGVSGLTMAGLVLLAYLGGIVSTPAALATWLAGTGITTLLIIWSRHGTEFRHTPEGLAIHLADWHGSVTMYQAETQRQIAVLDFQSEQQRLIAADAERRQAVELARLRASEIDNRRRMAERQQQQWEAWQPEAPAAIMVQSAETQSTSPDTTPTVGDAFARSMTEWVVSLYDGGISDSGLIVGRVPWAARSAWAEPDKQRAKRLACNGRPALVEAIDGGRYRLRTELFPAASVAAEWVATRLGEA